MAVLNLVAAASAGSMVADSIGSVDFSGLLQEIITLLPILLPTIIGFIAVRKGISFLIGSLRRA